MSQWQDLPPLQRVASFLLLLREMDSPNPGTGLSALIITWRLLFGMRKMIIGMDWASDGAFGEEAMAIWDAMEEDFQGDKMIARQKSKGKRELLNLHSSINYNDAKDSFRRRKGKAHMA